MTFREVSVIAVREMLRWWLAGNGLRTVAHLAQVDRKTVCRSTDPADLPAHKTAYAMRDLGQLKRIASGHGQAVGDYAARLLDIDLPWTKMRQVYRLLGLTRRFGPERVDACCRKALELDVVDVSLIARMLERGSDEAAGTGAAPAPATGKVIPMRFARTAEEFRPGGPGPRGGQR